MERESFIFYRSFASIQSLKMKERDWMVWAIINYALDGKEPEWDKAPNPVVLQILWDTFRPVIDANTKKYLAGKKGGAPMGNHNNLQGRRGKQEPSNNEPRTNQEPTINQRNDNVNVKDNVKDKEDIDVDTSTPSREPSEPLPVPSQRKITGTNQVMELWNTMVTESGAPLPLLAKFTDRRRKKVQVRWREFAEVGNPQEVVEKIFRNACSSKFFQGDNPRGWSGDFDWIFENDKNWVKTYEGKYDDRASGSPGGHDRLHITAKGPEDYEGEF